MEFNDAIIAVDKLIRTKKSIYRAGWIGGSDEISIDGKLYCQTIEFNSYHCKCFKDVCKFLQEHDFVYNIKPIGGQLGVANSPRGYGITIIHMN